MERSSIEPFIKGVVPDSFCLCEGIGETCQYHEQEEEVDSYETRHITCSCSECSSSSGGWIENFIIYNRPKSQIHQFHLPRSVKPLIVLFVKKIYIQNIFLLYVDNKYDKYYTRENRMSKFMVTVIVVLVTIGAAMSLYGEIRTVDYDYRHNGAVLQGYFAYDDAIKGKRPGVLIIHEWTGLGDYVKRRARELAEEGYVAFAMDMYGKGIRPITPQEAGAQATIYRSNRQLMRERAAVSLGQLKTHRLTDPARVAAIGYCFGGGAALELARSGVDLSGVVSFHGNLDTPNPNDGGNIKAKVLVLHGADDPHVSKESIEGFHQEMRDAGVDWQMVYYSDAVHSFTNPDSGNDKSRGAAYNEKADKRSHRAMIDFFNEIFK